MAILWFGGEDIDFPNGGVVTANTTAGYFRAGFARCAVAGPGSGVLARSNNFPGGAVTSCWFTARMNGSSNSAQQSLGLVKDSATNGGLFVGTATAGVTKIALSKWDGTTRTELAAESGTSLTGGTTATNRVDVQIVNYGASATVSVYVNFILVISYSGDVTVTGVTSLGAAAIAAVNNNGMMSEFIISSTDTRSLQGLVTLALTGAGTTNAWTNPTFTNINAVSFTDATPTFTNTAAQDNEYNVTDLPSGTFQVQAVKISARTAASTGASAAHIKLGYNSGGSLGFGSGSTKAPVSVYGTFEQLDLTNPVTSTAWAQSDMNALQLDLQSAT